METSFPRENTTVFAFISPSQLLTLAELEGGVMQKYLFRKSFFSWKSYAGEESERERVFYLLVHFPHGCNILVWARLTPGVWKSIQISRMDAEIQALERSSTAFPCSGLGELCWKRST